MKFVSLAFLLICGFLTSVDAQTSADLILINANIRTMDTRVPKAEALAVANGRIFAVGKTIEIRKFANDKTRVIDAAGKLVLPGFNDSHVHFTGIGNQFSHLSAKHIRNRQVVLDRIAFYASVLPKGRWILGAGLSLSSNEMPTIAQIDAVSQDNPVLIYLADHKFAMVNSAALKRAKISGAEAVVSNELVTRIRGQVPLDHERNWPEISETASNYAASLGVTSVQDVHTDDLFAILNTLAESGKLKTRVYECIGISDRRKAISAGFRAATGNSFVRRGCVKGFTHGSDDELAELTDAIAESDKAGLQVMIHAIGERSNTTALTAFEKAIVANGRRDRRFRIEHAARMRPGDVRRLSRSNIIASMQPHLFGAGSDDLRAIMDSSVTLAFGSDASITDLNPLFGIHAAVNSGGRSLTVDEAVRAYTLGSAFAEFQESQKGLLAVGKLADLVVLSDDIFTVDTNKIRDAKVLITVVHGKVVFEAK
ncbi:MAG: amidohydrolase [Chloracidobacterium sp.]|nr:amidohydrolase [Chloracidobacterium sp.]